MSKRAHRWVRAGLQALALTMAWFAAAPAQATTTLVINQLLPPADPFNQQVLRPWAAEVAKVTQGRVRISIPSAPVAPPDQLWNAVLGDVVDGAYVFNGLIPHQLPLEQIAALPFISGAPGATSIALWNTYERFLAKGDDYRNVKLLALFSLPPGEIFSMDRPIVRPDDLKGLRLWALPGVPQQVFSHSAAGVVSSPAVQVSELVAGKTVDAVAGIGDYNAQAFKILGYMKYETVMPGGLSAPSFSLVINKAKWDAIAPADRKAIEHISGLAFARRMELITTINDRARRHAEKLGLKVLQPSPALMRELKGYARPLFANWRATASARGVDAAAALAYFHKRSQAH